MGVSVAYYQGDYYQGDPFLGGLIKGIGGVLGGGLKIAGGLLPGPIGGVARFAGGILTRKAPAPRTLAPVGPIPIMNGGGQTSAPRTMPIATSKRGVVINGTRRKYRRMNVTNDKALRRAIRRTDGFVKLAKRALRGTGYTVVTKSSRARKVNVRESGAGSVTVH